MSEDTMPSVAETETEITPEVIEDTDSETVEETVDEVREKLAQETEKRSKAEELASNYRQRAEKAERKVEKNAPIIKEAKTSLSPKDNIALINAKVHEDDVDDILDYAKYKGISVSEALKSNVLKATLAEKNEQRDTAQATNTARTRTASSRISGEALLDKARKTGEVPESEADINSLLDARYTRK